MNLNLDEHKRLGGVFQSKYFSWFSALVSRHSLAFVVTMFIPPSMLNDTTTATLQINLPRKHYALARIIQRIRENDNAKKGESINICIDFFLLFHLFIFSFEADKGRHFQGCKLK